MTALWGRLDQFCRTPGATAERRSRGEETLHTAFERRQPFVHFDDAHGQLFKLLALARYALLEQDRLFDRLQCVADTAHTRFPVEMREGRVESRIGAVELGERVRMQLFETRDKAAQLRRRRLISRFIIERGPPDEFGRR